MTGKLRRWSSRANLARLALGIGLALASWAVRPLWGSLWRGFGNWWAAVLGGLSLVVAALLFALRDRREPAEHAPSAAPETLRTLTSRSIVLGATALLAVGAIAATLLLRTSSGPGAAERLDAIKTAATLVAGAGGAAALLLAARRQRSTELTLLHQQWVSRLTEHDAAERRLTDLYLKAVEQLGSPHAAVRHGGLYALERVAQDNPHQRQTVVNVICAYLRSNPHPSQVGGLRNRNLRINGPASAYSIASGDRHQEREVRLTAQRIIEAHLRATSEKFWPDIDLDLTGAALIGFDLAHCRLKTATFTNAEFSEDADFSQVVFDGRVSFVKAKFTGGAKFNQAVFSDQSRFDEVYFHQYAMFIETRFIGRTWFMQASYQTLAWFDEATFEGGANFRRGRFADLISLQEANFADDANFDECTFAGSASFTDTRFSGVTFSDSTFKAGATFTNTSFRSYARFENAKFLSLTDFSKMAFAEAPELAGAVFASRRPSELADYLPPAPPADTETTGPPASWADRGSGRESGGGGI